MMKKIILIFTVFGCAFLSISCHNDDDNNDVFDAVVLGKGLDCGNSYLIKFSKNSKGLPNTIDNTFYELNLPDEFKVEGKKIELEFRAPKDDEYIPCTNLGPGYSLIYVISAKSK